MNPYAFAITTLEHQAEISEQNAPIHEAEGNHAQGALGRMTAASCRAAIAVLQAAPAEGKSNTRAYTMDDVASYSMSKVAEGLAIGKTRWFLTMKDGLTITVDEDDHADDDSLAEALMARVNTQAGG
jgi:hypothetical protein